MKLEKLYQRGKIGSVELKNRIVMPPMGVGYASANGEASDEIIRYYEERARGGTGLIITEITQIDDVTGVGSFWQLTATKMSYVQRLKKLADAVHRHDTKIFLQLHHPGRQTFSFFIGGRQIVAPSAIPCGVVKEMPRELTTAECEEIIAKFVKGAVIAKTSGMDGVELHGAHGYLINQFLSPYTNKRTDKFGGDFYGRMKFLSDIVIGIRTACGPQFPISVRISADEFLEGGIKIEEGVKIARYLESIGVAAINISSGTYESGSTIIEPYFYKQGWKKHLAKAVKEAVKIPVIAVNTVKYPSFAESLLEEGVCDYVAVGRALLADPNWGEKGKQGKEDTIRKCMGCMFCFRAAVLGVPVNCNVNPLLGQETIYNEDTIKKNGDGRTVAVIGAGPAGMQAAYVLGQRGFKPVIFEKSDKVGGTLNLADKSPDKELITELIKTMTKEIESVGAEVRLNTPATVDAIKALDPYGVIIAAGGKPIIPDVAGADGENVYKAEDIIGGKVSLKGKKIAVIGGGVTGMETAEMLGADNEVTIVEMMPAIGTALYRTVFNGLKAALDKVNVQVLTEHALTEIKKDKVVLRHTANAFEKELDADVVVMAVGVRPDRAFADEIYANFDRVTTVGDSTKAGIIGDALREANNKAYVF